MLGATENRGVTKAAVPVSASCAIEDKKNP